MKKAICLISGGMDSTCLLHHVTKKNLGFTNFKINGEFDEVYALSFNYGQKHSRELECAKIQCNSAGVKEHKIVDLSFFNTLVTNSALTNTDIPIPRMKDVCGHPQLSTYFNNRNMIFLSIAASYAESVGASDIFYGAVSADQHSYWDCTQLFLQKINEILSLNRLHRITVHAPLVDMSKKEIIELGVKLGIDFSKTRTCYSENEIADGTCPACAARIKGWLDTKSWKDPLPYQINIPYPY